MLSRFFPLRRETPDAARVPDRRRVYAIGDIHGRLDLLNRLLTMIGQDDAARPEADTTLVFLGDYVDRGPDSAAVVDLLRQLAGDATMDAHFLAGNHEEVFLLALGGDERATRLFCRIGGRETALSYGVTPDEYERLSHAEVSARLQALVPGAHRDFLAGLEDVVVIGDYAFVHAGVRPGKPLDAQRREDLRWIRDPFLGHRGRLEKLIVHGHTISDEVEMLPHRIGIDTGGFQTDRLTALGLEGEARWVLQTELQ
jgi:serine/threonine protein phosphatase 1